MSSSDLNQCNFIGRLGADPEVRYMQNGKAVTNLRIAVGASWKDKDGARQDKVEWVPVVAFDKLGEICGEYLKKGSQVFVSGRFQTRKWQDKDGNDRYTSEIIIDQMQMLGKPADSSTGQPPQKQKPTSKPVRQAKREEQPSAEDDDFNDDVPWT